jgi:RimJ/RimL family protein N-acetyltransferase
VIWPPPGQALQGRIVRLEPLVEAHRGELAEAAGAAETWVWIDRRVPVEPGAFDAWFDERLAAREAGDQFPYLTRLRGEGPGAGRAVGSSSYLAVRAPHDGLEIGWTWLHPSAWRTGANREAKLLMLEQAFERLGCMRVEFKTDARNERSREALAGIGAGFEGVFRKHMLVPVLGVRDSAYFAIVDDEWPRVKRGLEAGRDRAGGREVPA